MAMSTTPLPAVRAAFTALIDYAGLFPPARLGMRDAVAEYLTARGDAARWMLGRFIVPLSRMAELSTALPSEEPLGVSVILDSGAQGLADLAAASEAQPQLRTETIEIVLADGELQTYARALSEHGLSGIPSYVEFPREANASEDIQAKMRDLSRAGFGAKVRCGGLEPGAFPGPGALARFVESAHQAGVAFKATAGLHHPVRHFNADAGVKMHGFLNVLAAAALAKAGANAQEITDAVACEEPARFAFDVRGFCFDGRCFDAGALEALRRQAFVAYGSCSFAEPVADLRAMHML